MQPEKVIISPDGTRLFSMKIAKSNAEFLISQARELPFIYRGKEVYDKTVELELGKPVVELFPELSSMSITGIGLIIPSAQEMVLSSMGFRYCLLMLCLYMT